MSTRCVVYIVVKRNFRGSVLAQTCDAPSSKSYDRRLGNVNEHSVCLIIPCNDRLIKQRAVL